MSRSRILLAILTCCITAAIVLSCKDNEVDVDPTVESITCSSSTFTASAIANQAYSATASVPYTGGNSKTFVAGSSIASTGVTGLTATLQAGTLASGAGNLLFAISGTPTAAGSASFALSFGGKSCTLALTVGNAAPSVSALTCASTIFSASATSGTAYSASASIPYTGGNGVAYTSTATISSTGVTGLSAALQAGTLASGAGNLSYALSGTPASSGTASFAISFGGQSCTLSLTVATGTVSSGLINSVVNSNYKSAVTISTSGTSITLKSKGVPEHVAAYWGVGHPLYEAPSLVGQTVNPGTMTEQNFAMTIPMNPAEATSKEATALGPIGMALNGVAIYNDREGGNVPVNENVLLSFERSGAHGGPGGLYHYHFNGDFTSVDDSKLIGFLRDGFPIYGRKDVDGSYPSNLDSNGGHVGATADFSTPIYHYHTSNTAYLNSRFYILKAGSYHGTKGTFTF